MGATPLPMVYDIGIFGLGWILPGGFVAGDL
jgi:hypothetical protein